MVGIVVMVMVAMVVMVVKVVMVVMVVANHGHSSCCQSEPSRGLTVILSIDNQRPPIIPQLNIMGPNNLQGPLHNIVRPTNFPRPPLILHRKPIHRRLDLLHCFLREVNHCVPQFVSLVVRGTFLLIWVNEFVSFLGSTLLTTSMSWQKWSLLPLLPHIIRQILIGQLVDLYFLLPQDSASQDVKPKPNLCLLMWYVQIRKQVKAN